MIRAINKFYYLFLCFALIDTAWAIGPRYILHSQTSLHSLQVLPSGDDILAKAEAAREGLERFMRESIEPRLAYEYKDRFSDEKDAVRLASLSRAAREDLQKIYQSQDEMRRRIEDYEGDDWDGLYGVTGLWRGVCADARETRLMKAEVDYYVAITAESEERQRILQNVENVCKLSEAAFGRTAGLLKVRALVLMARSEKSFEEQARSGLESILSAGDLHDETYFESALEKLKLEPNFDSRQIEALAKRLRRSKCADDFELNLKMAFFALRFGKVGFLKALIAKWPEAEDFAGRVILSEIVKRLDGGKMVDISIFEVELAAKAARQRGIEKYKEPLVKLCRVERFQTPLVLYVTARACAESAPASAIEYYLRATLARQKSESDKLKLDAVQIAEQGAKLAHKVYYEEPAQRRIVRRMIDYYCKIAGDGVDETIQYFYTCLLSGEGRTGEATELLQKIAAKRGRFSNQAKLDLIIIGLKNNSEDLQLRNELTKKLKNLIDSVDSASEQDRGVKAEAVQLYCQLILENDDKDSAQEVPALLEGTEGVDIQRSCILKAAALKKLGRFWSAVNELLKAAKFDNCEYGAEGLDILRTILDDHIDEHGYYMADFTFYIDACDQLAEYCLACAGPQWQVQAGLIRAEIAILCPRKSLVGDDNNENLDKAEQILTKLSAQGCDNDIDWLRCKARLLRAKGEYAEAFKAWGRVRAASKTVSGKQNRRWWRAKFYEIQCWSKLNDTTGGDIWHAIDVLQHTWSDIPEFWAMKLGKLKDEANR